MESASIRNGPNLAIYSMPFKIVLQIRECTAKYSMVMHFIFGGIKQMGEPTSKEVQRSAVNISNLKDKH